ncbi:MAG: Uncharacterized protein YneG, partial [uncultured Gemmatimonadetes bacterium]
DATLPRSARRALPGARPLHLPPPLPASRGGPGVPAIQGDGHRAAACRRDHRRAPGPGRAAERRQADADARPPRVRRAACHRHLLPGLPGQVAPHSEGARAGGFRASPRGRRHRAVDSRAGRRRPRHAGPGVERGCADRHGPGL